MISPLVTILMPVYNSQTYLQESIDSMLGQSYKNFEFIIVDDGSKDKSNNIIKKYSDKRIKLITHKTNLGIVASLNEGLAIAKGKYIIRMDSDDISFPDRLKTQVDFMESNPEVGVCGSWIEVFGTSNYIWRPPTSHEEIKVLLFVESALAHPSVCIRREILTKYELQYDKKYQYVEDYKLWIELSKITKLANVPAVLLKYRTHNTQIGQLQGATQANVKNNLSIEILKNLIPQLSESEELLHQIAMSWPKLTSYKKLGQLREWYEKLVLSNEMSSIYDKKLFRNKIAERWVGVCYLAEGLGWQRYFYVLSSWFLVSPSFRYILEIKISSIKQYILATLRRYT